MTKDALSGAVLDSRLGKPRAKREEEFRQLLSGKNLPTARYPFKDKTEDLPIISVSIDLPKYRLSNGRTASSQDEYLARNPGARPDLFSGDPELLDAQRAQHLLLLEMARQADLLNYFKSGTNKQVDPLILDERGFVVNGNRRLATWRDLLSREAAKYGHFGHIDVVVLPHCTDDDIDDLEANLQIKPDIQADYVWHAQANMLLQKRLRNNAGDRQLAERYGMKESQVRELIDMRNYADEYLKARGKEHHWSLVTDDEFAFRKIVNSRAKIKSVGEQELFKQAAYILIEEADQVSGRLYDAIPGIQEYLVDIKSKLQDRFKVPEPKRNDELDALLGGSIDGGAVEIALAAEIQKPANVDDARKIIIDVIDSQKQLKRDAKTAGFLLDSVARANAILTAAARDGLRPESIREGVEIHVQQLKMQLSRIESWLKGNAKH